MIRSVWGAVERGSLHVTHTRGPVVFRWCAGVAVLLEYLLNYQQRAFLFGIDAFMPIGAVEATPPLDMYANLGSPWQFELLFHAGLALAFLWTIGWRTHLTTPLNLLFWASLRARNSTVWGGGDAFLQLAMFYLCFANVAACGAWHVRRPPRGVLAVLHNASVFLCIFQLCVVYIMAGTWKLQGTTWPTGTALYYATRTGEFHFPGVSELLYKDPSLSTIMCYGTILFQVGFPFLVFLNEKTRILAASMGVVFHLGIATAMGLTTFAAILIGADLMILGDAEYVRIESWLSRFRGWCRGLVFKPAKGLENPR
ncbi:MAG: HTTM domain-containing protein [Myxococcales bacterium]|nr:HTTM domain-containing protein [Myxococcales bacterium]